MAAVQQVSNTLFNVDEFVKLLKDFNVIGFALAIIITSNIKELANAFIDGIVLPTVQPLLDSFNGNNKGKLYLGKAIVIDYQKFVSALLKFIILSVLIYVTITMGIKISKPITWVSVRSVAPGVQL